MRVSALQAGGSCKHAESKAHARAARRAPVADAPQPDARAVDAAAEVGGLDVGHDRLVVLNVAPRRHPVARLAVAAAKGPACV